MRLLSVRREDVDLVLTLCPELEQLRLPMMMRLREQVAERLDGERWQYESVEPFRTMM